MPDGLTLAVLLLSIGVALSPSRSTAQNADSLLSRLADLDVSEEVRAIDQATQLTADQEERLEGVLAKTKARAQEIKSTEGSRQGNRSAMDLLIQTDDEVHAVLDCEQREAYRKYRRDKRSKHLEHKRSLGEPSPRARWTPSDAKNRVERVTSKMELSDEQKAQIDEIYANAELESKTVEALEDDEQRRARTVVLHFETQDRLYATLSCSQREELRKAKQAQAKNRRQRLSSTD